MVRHARLAWPAGDGIVMTAFWGKGHKYKAKATFLDGHRFASKAEAERYAELRLLERARQIVDLELQPRYTLEHNGVKLTTYVGDARYKERDADGRLVVIVEDTKGVRTAVYELKKRLMLSLLGIAIREVCNGKVVDPNAPKRRKRRRKVAKEIF